MTYWKRCGRRPSWPILGTLLEFSWRDLRKPRRRIRTAGASEQIRTDHLPFTVQQRNSWANSLSRQVHRPRLKSGTSGIQTGCSLYVTASLTSSWYPKIAPLLQLYIWLLSCHSDCIFPKLEYEKPRSLWPVSEYGYNRMYTKQDRKLLALVTDLNIGLNRLSILTFLTTTCRNTVTSKQYTVHCACNMYKEAALSLGTSLPWRTGKANFLR
jgi:hypothetical protein